MGSSDTVMTASPPQGQQNISSNTVSPCDNLDALVTGTYIYPLPYPRTAVPVNHYKQGSRYHFTFCPPDVSANTSLYEVPDHTASFQAAVSSFSKAKQKFFPHHPLMFQSAEINHIKQADATGSLNSTQVLQPDIRANTVPHYL